MYESAAVRLSYPEKTRFGQEELQLELSKGDSGVSKEKKMSLKNSIHALGCLRGNKDPLSFCMFKI